MNSRVAEGLCGLLGALSRCLIVVLRFVKNSSFSSPSTAATGAGWGLPTGTRALGGGGRENSSGNRKQIDIPVIQTRPVTAGETVGYSNTWTATTPRQIATISAGYADGILRAMGPNTRLFSDNIGCPIVGRISMDLICVDVTLLDHVPESLQLLNAAQGIDTLADGAGTIGYEILTSLGGRYERRYTE